MVHGTWVWCDMGSPQSGGTTHVVGTGSILVGLPLIIWYTYMVRCGVVGVVANHLPLCFFFFLNNKGCF